MPAGTGGVAEAFDGVGTALCLAMLARTSMMLAPLPLPCWAMGCAAGGCGGFCTEPGNPGGGLPGGVVETAT